MVITTKMFTAGKAYQKHLDTCECVIEKVTPENQARWGHPIGTPIKFKPCAERERLDRLQYEFGQIQSGAASKK